MNLKSWLEYNDIEYFQDGNIYTINEVKYYHIHHKDDKIFDLEFKLIISDQELLHLDQDNIENLIFYFGTQWYYTSLYKTELNLLKYLGKSKKYSNNINGFLGIHGKYEILNGTRDYNDWCKKASFLGYTTLGICEKHTLAGSYVFQQACQKNNIKSIIGETLSVNIDQNIIDVKIYVKNQIGWENLLKLHKIHNIDNHTNKRILKQDLLNHYQGLCYVITPDSNLDLLDDDLLNLRDIYYQLDFCQFISNNKDKDRILNIGKYLQELRLSPILINDAYYLDSEDYKTKILLNEIGKTGFQNLSKDQYLKSYQDIIDSGISLFKDQEIYKSIVESALDNCNQLCNECNFIIEKKHSYLPKYIMNDDEKLKFSDNKQLFYAYIEDGFIKKVLNKNLDFDKYQDRLVYEIEVLEKGNVIDYFLILSDIVNFCKKQNILTGIGRGSAAGSLVAYLLNIVEIDPIQYDLLFERFLNEGRLLKGTLPDIDQDVPSKHRGDIIQYVIHKYGESNVVSIGTAQNFKLKSLFKDLLKYKGESFKDANNLSISLPRELDMGKKVDLFKNSTSNKNLKNSLNKHADVVEDLDKIIGQPRSFGKHAAGVVITPNSLSDRDVVVSSDLIPLRRDGDINITEWEKDILENNGFLKLDLLGLSQLDKIMEIIKLVKERHGADINILEIPLDDTLTFELFKKGLNEDVFQFGAVGLKEYCKQLQPDTIHDLIATVALYRPGSMGSGSHLRYIDVKRGSIPTSYYKGTELILKDTLSVLVYQEQVMRICTDLAGFTLKEADDVRKAISKKDLELLHQLKVRFVSSVQELSQYTEQEAEDLWKDIEYFGEYSFNKCLSGDTVIKRPGMNNSSYKPTIAEMYKIKNNFEYAERNNKLPLRQKFNYRGYGSSYSLNSENKLVKNKIKDIYYQGKREIYRMTLENDTFIDCTDNHKFMTDKGQKELVNIDLKDSIFVNCGYQSTDTMYRFNTQGDNFPVKGQTGFQKRDTECTRLREYKKNHKGQFCEICNTGSTRLEVHHKDGNHGNNDFSNLTTLCVSCHKKEHYKMGRTKTGEKGLKTQLIGVKEIKFLKIDDVYDVEMEAPYHTFTLDNNIVTCNSHAACYATTGYYTQWLKAHYPSEFYTVALSHSDDFTLPNIINEISSSKVFDLHHPDINKSNVSFNISSEDNVVYWGLLSIKFLGEKSVLNILKERQQGQFYSFSEFISRCGSFLNKRVLVNLTLTGTLDKINNITDVRDRLFILEKFLEKNDVSDIVKKYQLNTLFSFNSIQKQLCGFDNVNFMQLNEQHKCTSFENLPAMDGKNCKVCGIVDSIKEFKTAKGVSCAVKIQQSGKTLDVVFWSEHYQKYKPLLNQNNLLLVSGFIKKDLKYSRVQLQVNNYSTIQTL